MLNNRIILITGGTGSFGNAVLERFLNTDHFREIRIFSRDEKKQDDMRIKLNNSKLKFYIGDVRDYNSVDKAMRGVDYVFHAAALKQVPSCEFFPLEATKTNVFGAINMLDLALKLKVKILQASTSEVYGDPEVHPQPESYAGKVNPIGIRACYDEGKRCAETLFFDYHRQEDLSIKVIRIFNTYGPNMDRQDGRVVSNFIIQALANKNITIFGDGTQTRSFCYVDDLIHGLISMMETSKSTTGPINLGNPNEFSMNQLAKLVIKLTNSKSKIEYTELPKDDPKQRQPNISLAKSKLNWSPLIELEEGLQKTINYFKNSSTVK